MILFITLTVLWLLLTIWIQYRGNISLTEFPSDANYLRALILYNSNPIFNTDKKIYTHFAQGLVKTGFHTTIASTRWAEKQHLDYDLYIFCSNAYNCTPDWQSVRFIKQYSEITNKPVASLILGTCSTKRVQRKLNTIILKQHAYLLGSETYSLAPINSNKRPSYQNIDIHCKRAYQFGLAIGQRAVLLAQVDTSLFFNRAI